MDPRLSFKVYPRLDQEYKARGSLDFDMIRTKIFKDRPEPPRHDVMVYTIYAFIGILTGLLAVLLTGLEDEFSKYKAKITSDIIGGSDNNMWMGWLFFCFFSTGLAFIVAVLIVYKAP